MSEIINRVLLAEDEEDAREILEFYLDTIFEDVKVASNGKDALEIYKDYLKVGESFDLIITDIKMPNMDGFSMIEEITKLNDNQKFIIVSAHKDEEFLFKSINLNVVGYFVKPLEIKDMMELIKKIKVRLQNEKKEELKENDYIKINKTFKYHTLSNLLYKDSKSVNLTNKETLLLKSLMDNKNKVVSIETLKENIWNTQDVSDVTVRTVIKRLKDKIVDEDFIITKKGIGYIIEIL